MGNHTTWHEKVYKQPEPDMSKTREWREMRSFIVSRDGFRCYRCDKKFPKKELTVHHIIAREDGGGDNPENLITLCNPCHDLIEGKAFTRADIIGYRDPNEPLPEPKENIEETPADWHAWVYGGAKNPNK